MIKVPIIHVNHVYIKQECHNLKRHRRITKNKNIFFYDSLNNFLIKNNVIMHCNLSTVKRNILTQIIKLKNKRKYFAHKQQVIVNNLIFLLNFQ